MAEDKPGISKNKIEVQGHRGQRGHSPENSIPGFLAAIDKGVDVLELDVVMSKDHQVVVSHEPFMSAAYVLDPGGSAIAEAQEQDYNLYEMSYDSIRQFDIGSKGNTRFPEQKKLKTYKPLLGEMIDSVENYISQQKFDPVKYNIEIKSVPEEYDVFQPKPDVFVSAVMQVLKDKNVVDKCNIQSFDPEVLEVMHKRFPQVKLAYLVGEGAFEENMEKLSFQPEIYSPHYKLLDQLVVDRIRMEGMQVIPWTVNDQQAIDQIKALGVDGIITDYPERAVDR